MDRITQEAYHRQRLMKSYARYGASETAIRYKTSRKTVYKWLKRYDGTIESLKDKSRKPHSSPRAHTETEKRMIKRVVKKHKWQDLLLSYQELLSKRYNRSYGGFKRIVQKLKEAKPKKQMRKRKNKPYARAAYPGQKVQIDVKYVPSSCVVGGVKYYQFTAKDECTRWTYRQMYDERSTYNAKKFMLELIQASPFPIRMVQTDNGTEFTNALLVVKSTHKTLFEEALVNMGIEYKRIRIATPRHNGKVERQHRTDEMRFYDGMKMYSLADGRKQLAEYNRKSNNIIMTCLNMETPNQVLSKYLAIM